MRRFLFLFALILLPALPAHAQQGPAVQAVPVGDVTAEAVPDPDRLPVPGYVIPSRKYTGPGDARLHKDKRRWARPRVLEAARTGALVEKPATPN